MTIRVTNTMTGRKEAFEPTTPGEVGMYVCGLTPYDELHLGHARTYVAFDVIRRHLERRGLRVRHVQNVTDVDDRIIARAREAGVDPLAFADRFQKDAEALLATLGVKPADAYPRVSGSIPGIVRMTETLIEKGHAYATKDEHGTSVYFSVRSDPDYGKLSRRNLDELLEGVRKDTAEGKRDPLDFALWKSEKPGEVSWDSPWGKGRPGWHIECSVMATEALGPTVDVHGGGLDLIFPHHENEVAQSESATGVEPFSKYWLHTGFLTVDGEKMSKSLGNFVTVRAALSEWKPQVLRLWLVGTHYRSPIDYSEAGLAQAARNLERFENMLANVAHARKAAAAGAPGPADRAFLHDVEARRAAFEAAMDDDFNTPVALAALSDLVSDLNKYAAGGAANADALARGEAVFRDLALLLGILPEDGGGAADDRTVSALLDLLLEARQAARAKKDFGTSDRIRDRLAELGFLIEDSPTGPKWRRK